MHPLIQVLIVVLCVVMFILTYYFNHKIKMPNNTDFDKCNSCTNSVCKNKNKINDCEEYVKNEK